MNDKIENGDLIEGVSNLSRTHVRGTAVRVGNEVGVEDFEVLEAGSYQLSPGLRTLFLDEKTVTKANIKIEDVVNHPSHYTSHPSGIECIQITEHMNFLLGNAVKYIWRADLKNDAIEDLKKARFYLDREIQKREAQA